MALRAVPDHPKFAALKTLLKIPKGAALGWLEAVWHFTARFTPQGNIGKYRDLEIEAWVEWDGEEGALILALIESGWIDRSAECRLFVHDWHEHADAMVHTILARECRLFSNGHLPDSGRLNQRERERFNGWIKSQGIAANPVGRPAKTQPKYSHSTDEISRNAAENPKPVPEPGPVPVPVPVPKKPSRAKRERPADERHQQFKEAIKVYWDSKNRGVDMPWGPAEGKQLGMFLREAPHITLEQFKGMLRGRYKSDVNHGDRPSQWIRYVTSYAAPVDRYNRPANAVPNGAAIGLRPEREDDSGTRADYERWLAMPGEYRKAHRWIDPIPEETS